jgi:large subunit ribosomal protein L15
MSYLHELKPHPRSTHSIKRVGRGPGSNDGKTSGRGHKGSHQRGPGPRAGFEGGQMPIIRTLPKRGFTAKSVARYQVLNVSELNALPKSTVHDVAALHKLKLVRSSRMPVKVLGEGELKNAVSVKVNAASKTAVDKITKAGGTCEIIG